MKKKSRRASKDLLLQQMAEQHAIRAWRLAMSLMNNASDADDVMQQAFATLAAPTTRIPEEAPWPWFAAVITNCARNAWRAQKRQRTLRERLTLMPESREQSASQKAIQREFAAATREALERLPQPEREALTLTYVAGLTQAEAAKALGIPLGTLKTNARRGADLLRERLRDLLPESERLDDQGLSVLMASAPLALPPGGLEAAAAKWISASSMSATAFTGQGTLIAGAITMTKSTLAGVCVLGGILLGIAGTLVAMPNEPAFEDSMLDASSKDNSGSSKEHESTRVDTNDRNPIHADSANSRDEPTNSGEPHDDWKKRALSAERRLQVFLDEQAEEEAEAERLRNALPELIQFGGYKGVPELQGESLRELGKAYALAQSFNHQILKLQAENEEVPEALRKNASDARNALNKLIAPLRVSHLKKFPSNDALVFSRVDAHPLIFGNLLLAQLEVAGIGPSYHQRASISELGEEYERQLKARMAGYDDLTLTFRKLKDEFELKQAFLDNLLMELTVKQRELVVNPKIAGLKDAFLFSPSVLLSPIMINASNDELLFDEFHKYVKQEWGVDDAYLEQNAATFELWRTSLKPLLQPVHQEMPIAMNQVHSAISVQLQAMETLVRGLSNDNEVASRIRLASRLFLLARYEVESGSGVTVNYDR